MEKFSLQDLYPPRRRGNGTPIKDDTGYRVNRIQDRKIFGPTPPRSRADRGDGPSGLRCGVRASPALDIAVEWADALLSELSGPLIKLDRRNPGELAQRLSSFICGRAERDDILPQLAHVSERRSVFRKSVL